MSPERGALLALARFELRRGVARQGAWMGALIFVGAVAIGAYDSRYRSGQMGLLFTEGFIIWSMGLIAFGLAVDRGRAFDEYLIRNHTTVGVYVAAKVIAMITLILAAGVFAFFVRLVATSDPSDAIWTATCMTLFGLMVAPFAMMVESHVNTSMPAAVVILGYVVAGGLMLLGRGSTIVFDATGVAGLAAGSWPSLVPVAWRTAIALVVGFAIAGGLVRLSLRRY